MLKEKNMAKGKNGTGNSLLQPVRRNSGRNSANSNTAQPARSPVQNQGGKNGANRNTMQPVRRNDGIYKNREIAADNARKAAEEAKQALIDDALSENDALLASKTDESNARARRRARAGMLYSRLNAGDGFNPLTAGASATGLMIDKTKKMLLGG